MKRTMVVALIGSFAISLLSCSQHVRAEETQDSPDDDKEWSGPKNVLMAFIDVRYICENHIGLHAEMENLKTNLGDAQARDQAERQKILELKRGMLEVNPDSVDYGRLEEKMLTLTGLSEAHIKRARAIFQREQEKAVLAAYRDIQKETRKIMSENNISVVTNVDLSDYPQVDPIRCPRACRVAPSVARVNAQIEHRYKEDVSDIKQYIKQPVVALNENLDITPLVLTRLNRKNAEKSITLDAIQNPAVDETK